MASLAQKARADAREHRLLAAAREVLAERGFDADITEILSRSGVGTGTAYRHFPNKEALIRTIVVEMVERTNADLLEISSTIPDAREAIAATMQVGYRRVREYGQLPIELFAGTEPAEYQDIVDRPALEGFFASLIQRGIEQGHFRKDVDVEHAAAMWFGLAAPQALHSQMKHRSVEEIAEATTRFFLAGLGACQVSPSRRT